MAARRRYCVPTVVVALLAASFAAQGATTLTPGVKDVSQDAVTITWGKTQDLCFSNYDIQFRPAGGASWSTATSIQDAGRTDYRLTGLAPETAYEARVIDIDCLGSQPSGAVPFTTTPLRAGGLTDGQVQLIVAAIAVAAAVAIVAWLRVRAKRSLVENADVIVRLDPGDARVRDCVQCGKPVTQQFCGKCGAKQYG